MTAPSDNPHPYPLLNPATGPFASLVDLLNAQAHAPEHAWEDHASHSSSGDASDDDLSTEEDGVESPTTSVGGSGHGHDQHVFEEPHQYDEEEDPNHPSFAGKVGSQSQLHPQHYHPLTKSPLATPPVTPSSGPGPDTPSSVESHVPSRVRGASLLTEPPSLGGRRRSSTATSIDLTIKELALDGIDNVDSVIERQRAHHEAHTTAGGSDSKAADESDEEFLDPKVTDGEQSPEKRLQTLTEEFGHWPEGQEEVFVQSIPGALYRGVLVKGLLALTNRRLFIYAFLPRVDSQKTIRSGPVTVHFPGAFTRKRRAWIELTGDSVTWFRSSDTLYEPVGACRLSQAKAVFPWNPERPRFFTMELIDGRVREFELDTAESAVGWRNDIEAAVFTFRATADKLRLSLPLHLITKVNVEPYMSVGEKVEVLFDSGKCPADERTSFDSEWEAGSSTPQDVAFGYLKNHHDFAVNLRKYVDLAAAEVASTPCVRPILEIDSEQADEDTKTKEAVEQDASKLASEFVKTFALKDKPSDVFISPSCELVRSLPAWGSLCISSKYLCFWRKAHFGRDVKLRIPLKDIDDVAPCKAFGFRIVGLAIQVHGAPDVRLDFHSRKRRDELIAKLKEVTLHLKAARIALTSPIPTFRSMSSDTSIKSVNASLPASPTSPGASINGSAQSVMSQNSYIINPVISSFAGKTSTVLGQDIEENVSIPAGLAVNSLPRVLGAVGTKKISGLHFVCLTIGSRGDVQPYISLGKELMKDGNTVTIASHPEYRSWVEGFGMGFKEVGGDPAVLMKLSVEHKILSPGFFRESLGHFRHWFDELLRECWEACQEADILIESPSTFGGIHSAEALGIPYFRAFTMPWTSTSTYPQAFAASVDLGPTYNLLSYALYDSIIWKATSGQVNKWRKEMLGLKPTNLHKMSAAKTPFIYNFSSAVVPRPNDWRDFVNISGYWFLDSEAAWEAPAGLLEFIQKAREDGKPVIYVGFGSIVVPDSAAVTQAVVNAVLNADVRAVLAKGWSDRGATKGDDVVLPSEIFSVPSIAHDKLFPLIDAACHHGGAGTTGASLRAGLPTLIHPFFGDQYFWATRCQKLGAGVKVNSLNTEDLTAAFKQATTDRVMREKAQAIGEKIRSENGPRQALVFIYDHIHLAQERANIRAQRARADKKDIVARTRTLSCRSSTPTVQKSSSRGNSREGSRDRSGEKSKRSFTLPSIGNVLRTSSISTQESADTV